MAADDQPDPSHEWSDRDGGFAYVPKSIILPVAALGVDVLLLDGPRRRGLLEDRAQELVRHFVRSSELRTDVTPLGGDFVLVRGEFDTIDLVDRMRASGIAAQPDHVFFAHCSCVCGPHPAALCTPWAAAPPGWDPVAAARQSLRAGARQSLRAGARQSLRAGARQSLRAGAVETIGTGGSAARVPVKVPTEAPVTIAPTNTRGMVVILDTGFPADPTDPTAWAQRLPNTQSLTLPLTPDPPGGVQQVVDKGSNDQDSFLDTVGGHGAFIAGIIERRAGGTPVRTVRVLDTQSAGLVSESTIHTTVAGVINALGAPAALNRTILCMSFGGPVWGAAGALAGAIHDAQAEGIVVIASAGNESTCEPQYPAAVPGVVSVGAIGPDGPADFTNYGPWVRCCAPGVDIVSTFFDHDFGAEPGIDGDPDDFEGWAVWSGTSFAVPAVAAALLRHMALTGKTAKESVADVIDAPWLGRIPGLGTVVNA